MTHHIEVIVGMLTNRSPDAGTDLYRRLLTTCGSFVSMPVTRFMYDERHERIFTEDSSMVMITTEEDLAETIKEHINKFLIETRQVEALMTVDGVPTRIKSPFSGLTPVGVTKAEGGIG